MPSEVSVQCLLSAAKHSSFTKAADELYMTRQAVSQQIAILEKELGLKLFDRTTAKVDLTPCGELYVRYFSDAIRQWRAVQRRAEAILTTEGEKIRVGCLHAIDLGERVLELVEHSRNQGHAFDIMWERREADDLLNHLLDGAFDVAFVFEKEMKQFRLAEQLDSFLFATTQGVIVARDNYPLVRAGAIAADFEREPCFLSAGMIPNEQAKQGFLNEFSACGVRFTDIRTCPNRESVQTMVELGRGITVCTLAERFAHFPNMIAYPMDRYQGIFCVWKSATEKPQTQAFVDAMRGKT